LIFEGIPILETEIERKEDLDKEVRASGFVKGELGEGTSKAFDIVQDMILNKEEG